MKLKHMFIIQAIIALAYALGELFIPATLLKIYGLGDTPGAEIILMARLFGWGLAAVGLITALVANAPQSEARQSIVKALFVAHVVGLIVCLMGVLNGTFNAVGWSAVILYLFLAAGFGYFWFVKPEKA
jgi:hypothetical protein